MRYRVKGASLRYGHKRHDPEAIVEIADEAVAKPLLEIGRIEPAEEKPKPEPKPSGKAPAK